MKIDDVIAEAGRMLKRMGIVQDPDSRVAAHTDIRTFRLYRTQKLIDRPDAKVGISGVYGRRHVLQLVAIKALQAQRLPLREIAKRLAGADEAALEKMIGRKGLAPSAPKRAKDVADTRWIMVRLDGAFAMVDQTVLDKARPSALRALGDELAARLQALRR
jgi:DNA-binding transcriptional MerR regulator